jgi:hypothetical protein
MLRTNAGRACQDARPADDGTWRCVEKFVDSSIGQTEPRRYSSVTPRKIREGLARCASSPGGNALYSTESSHGHLQFIHRRHPVIRLARDP